MSLPTNTALSFNSQTSKLSVAGKPIATTNYVDEQIAAKKFVIDDITDNTLTNKKFVGNNNVLNNTAFGNGSLLKSTAYNATAIGASALENNTTGNNNTAVGFKSLNKNTTGENNSAHGFLALEKNTTGANNTAHGFIALNENTTGSNNTAHGFLALQLNTTGPNNTANGFLALQLNTSGSNNTSSGFCALQNNTTGGKNTSIGNEAGINNKTNNNNTFLGANSDLINNTNSWSNSTAIGYNSKITASNQIVLGTSAETVRIPKFTTAGVVRNTASGDLSASGLIVASDITDATITNAKLASGIDKSKVGLGNVDNTSDADKPVSTAQQTALDAKATIEDLNEQTLYSNSYYANDNKVDIQTALDKSGASQGVVVFASSGSYGGSNLLINNRSNIGIIAPVVGNVTITELPSSRGIDISGANSTRVRLTGIQVKGMTTIDGTLGRHYFSNMNFQGGLTFTGSMTNWVTFNNCDFSTSFTVNSTFAGTIYLVNCAFNGVTLTLNNTSPIQVILSNCSGIGAYPSALKAYLAGINSLSSGASSIATSTATVSSLATVGVVHNNASGVLSTSLIVTADITDATITNAKLASGIDKSKVGLENVNNTSDADKAISTATQSALDAKANKTELNVMPTTQPVSPIPGSFWFDISTGYLNIYNGEGWVSFSPVT